MPHFLANWEVESDLILPNGISFIRYDHPSGKYQVFLRNVEEKRSDQTYLSMQFIFSAPELGQAKEIAEVQAKEFLDHLTFVSNLRIRLRALLQIWNWEQPGEYMRECLYWSAPQPNSDAPFEQLDGQLLKTLSLLQQHPSDPRLGRALKWYANGVAARYRDDQFAYFWFAIEVVAQIAKQSSPVPDRCPKCRGPLYCDACGQAPLHRPYPKQAIEQLFVRTVAGGQGETLYQQASEARNRLMHGDEVHAIESSIKVDFSELVNKLGGLAWTVLLNQFVPSMIGKKPMFLHSSQYVDYKLSGVAHVHFGFTPNFENPDPAHFPKLTMSLTRSSPPPLSNP